MYKTEGKLHDNRPYWVLVNGPARYIYWYKTHKTWYLSDRLGSTSGEYIKYLNSLSPTRDRYINFRVKYLT